MNVVKIINIPINTTFVRQSQALTLFYRAELHTALCAGRGILKGKRFSSTGKFLQKSAILCNLCVLLCDVTCLLQIPIIKFHLTESVNIS